MTLKFKCNEDNESHEFPIELHLQDVLSVVSGQNLGEMLKNKTPQAEIAKHIRVMTAILNTLCGVQQ